MLELTGAKGNSFGIDGVTRPYSLLSCKESEVLGKHIKELVSKFPALGSPSKLMLMYKNPDEYWRYLSNGGVWFKSAHLHSSLIKSLASNHVVLGLVGKILGNSFKLWGSQILTKGTGNVHRWHVDAETYGWKAINIWLGVENCSVLSSLKVIPGSQQYADKPQDLAVRDKLDLYSDREVLNAARVFDKNAEIVTLSASPGQFSIFSSELWHGSENKTQQERSALLFQYSAIDADVRIPQTFNPPIAWNSAAVPCLYFEYRLGGYHASVGG